MAQSRDMKRVYGELGTLYAKCGGVFGVAGFVDKCMDKWMADPTLNGNAAVTTWHETAQRPGFKFLVVQIVCNLTGGPQIYTGRPIDEAHKHLNISEHEWDTFMELFNAVCDEFSLPGDVIGDLNALMISMEEDCVVHAGETAPPNPGPALPRGNSLYARLGGVYPLALFADRLVDAVLADDRIDIRLDEKRTEASLKYLFTELVCSITGGPEVRTAPDHDETKLLIPKAQWAILANTVKLAADHLPGRLVTELVQTIMRHKDGIVDAASPDAVDAEVAIDLLPSTVKDLRAAAAGQNLTTAADARRAAGARASVAARRRVHGDPRTLYGRGGGVFGLAKLSDRLMDTWMENHLLNANQSVAKWHESQQKFGFKFLVTQLLGYLTGGPQRYTGVSMEAAHKHLGISSAEWNSFVDDAERVFREFNVEQSVHRELVAIIQGFQEQVTVKPGENVPADPGLCRKRPDGSSAYAHLGGIYPIALYVDRLIESVLQGQLAMRIPLTGTRTPAALKYLVTELLANATGGPELVTAQDFEEAKLGIDVEQWDEFLRVASEAACVWPTPHHRELIIRAVKAKKTEFCIGLVDESGVTEARRQLLESGYGVLYQAAALDECNDDASKALELLRGGWTPAAQVPSSSSSLSSSVDSDQPAGSRCPFRGNGFSGSQASGCPFLSATRGNQVSSVPVAGGGVCQEQPPAAGDHHLQVTIQLLSEIGRPKAEIIQLLEVSEAIVDAALSEDRYAIAARFLAKRKKPFSRIAQALNMSEARVHSAVNRAEEVPGQTAPAGRILGNPLQRQLDDLCDEDSELCCPVTLVLFKDPVVASDGFLYEADSVKMLIRNQQKSPITRETLKKEFYPAKQKKSEVLSFRESRADALLEFADYAMSREMRMSCIALDRVQEYLEVLKVAQHPELARKTAALWEKTGRPLPRELASLMTSL